MEKIFAGQDRQHGGLGVPSDGGWQRTAAHEVEWLRWAVRYRVAKRGALDGAVQTSMPMSANSQWLIDDVLRERSGLPSSSSVSPAGED